MDLNEWTNKEADRVRETRGYRSRFYHSEYEGYAERQYVDKKGKKQIERIYAGEYFDPELSVRAQKKRRIWYSILFVMSVLCFGTAGWQETAANLSLCVTVPVALSLVCLFLTLLGLVRYIPAGSYTIARMKKGPRRLKWYSFVGSVCLFLAAADTIIFVMLNPNTMGHYTRISVCCYLMAGIALLMIGITEYRTVYRSGFRDVSVDHMIVIR